MPLNLYRRHKRDCTPRHPEQYRSSEFEERKRGPAELPNHASYIHSWLKPLNNSKHEIFRAAADAQKGADMILGFHPDFADHFQPYRQPESIEATVMESMPV